jgi:hypothetical protein
VKESLAKGSMKNHKERKLHVRADKNLNKMHGVIAKILHQWVISKKGMKEHGYYAAA